MHYWKEETLCRFLALPDIESGQVMYQMATYLGAFPFASQAPCILTMEAMLKVVVIMTERFGKVLKKGKADRDKLLFRSIAVFDRRMSLVAAERPTSSDLQPSKELAALEEATHALGFDVDNAKNDEDEEEDDDELALAALDALDAIEVFKHDQRSDTKIHHAQIPVDNFRRLIMLLLVMAPLEPQESLSKHAQRMTESRAEGLRRVADSILWSFTTPEQHPGILYSSFNTIIPTSLPHLFDGLNPLFEHFLFSKNLDLHRQRRKSSVASVASHTSATIPMSPRSPTSPTSPQSPLSPDLPPEPLIPKAGEILDLNVLSQLAFFLKGSNVFRRLRPLYLGADAGFSMGSIEQKVFNWQAPSILLVSGTRLSEKVDGMRERQFVDALPPKRFPDSSKGNSKNNRVVYGAYLDVPWKHTHKEATGGSGCLLFQLDPIHEVFRPSSINKDYLCLSKSGLSFGSPPPRSRSVSGLDQGHAIFGAVSLNLDEGLEFGLFNHDHNGGGSFHPSTSRKSDWQDRFEIESLEIWGVGGSEEAERQRKAWEFEEREAAARKHIRHGKDIESDRALLEMAGLVGNHNASGGSMG